MYDFSIKEDWSKIKKKTKKKKPTQRTKIKVIKRNVVPKQSISLYHENLVQILVDCFQCDCTIEEACLTAWISTNTYNTWMKEIPWFKERIDLAKRWPFIKAKKNLIAKIDSENDKVSLTASIELLKRRVAEYSDKIQSKVEVTWEITEEEQDKINKLLWMMW